MDDLLRQLLRADTGVREALALLGDLADVDRRLRTVLHAAEAADAVRPEAGPAAQEHPLRGEAGHEGGREGSGLPGHFQREELQAHDPPGPE